MANLRDQNDVYMSCDVIELRIIIIQDRCMEIGAG